MVHRLARFTTIAFVGSFAVACITPPPSVIDNRVVHQIGFNADTIMVKLPSFGMYARTSMRLDAVVYMKGERDPSIGTRVHWSSNDVNVAWVSESGILTLQNPGKAILTAKSGTMRTARTIVVQPNPVARIKLAVATRSDVYAGEIVHLVARVETEDGTSIPDALLAFGVNLRGMPHTAGVMVSGEGLFTAEHAGDYLIIAASGGISGHTMIRVLARSPAALAAAPGTTVVGKIDIDGVDYEGVVGTSIPLRATMQVGESKFQRKEAVVSWSSSDGDVAWVDALGVVTFRSGGRVTITAKAGERHATKKFNVQRESAARISMTVNSSDVRTGDTVRLREEVWQKGGTPIRRARVNYAVVAHGSNAASRLASITDDRKFVALQPGVYTIIAELGGRAEQTTIVVRGRGLPRVSLR